MTVGHEFVDPTHTFIPKYVARVLPAGHEYDATLLVVTFFAHTVHTNEYPDGQLGTAPVVTVVVLTHVGPFPT